MTAAAESRRGGGPPRLRQVPGGWLLARDLRDTPALPGLRRAQHTIAAHATWGVSGGLQVMADRGRVWVSAGCAVDRCGRTAVLARMVALTVREGSARTVVLTGCGTEPQAVVALREPGREEEADIPLARIDAKGAVHDGDGDRQWLRRPGPCRRLGGLVPRGAPLLLPSHRYAWGVHVDLSRDRLDVPPAVVAVAAGAPPGVLAITTTVEVTSVTEGGFDLLVRHGVSVIAGLSTEEIHTAPHALAWVAVVAAARPEFPPEEST